MKRIFCFLSIFAVISVCHGQSYQLNYYVDIALHNSPLLKDYQNQVQLNIFDSLLIRAANRPQVTGTSLTSYAPTIGGWGYDGAITNGGNYSALVGVNKPILNRRILDAQFENLQLLRESLRNISRISEQDLKRTIIGQYITAYGDLQQLEFHKGIDTLLSREEAILKKLTQGNVYKQVDYLAFLVTLQQHRLVIKQFEIQYKNDFATLNYLSGITDTSAVILQTPDLKLYILPEPSSSVFFKQYEIDSLRFANQKTLVAANYRPKINLLADGGFNSTLAYQGYKNFGTSFGITATVPIYDGKQKKLQYSKIDIQERTRTNYKSFFTSQYRQQISQLTQQLRYTEELIDNINSQLKYSSSLIDVNGKLLETGEVRIADFILALNNYLNAKNLVTQNTITRYQIINQLNYWNR